MMWIADQVNSTIKYRCFLAIRFGKFSTIGFLILIFCLPDAKATHIMGSDITYKHVGKDSFEVTLTVYRDCTGIDLSKPELSVTCNSSGSIGQNVDTTLISYSPEKDITPICNQSKSECQPGGNYGYGIEKFQSTYLVDLAGTNCCKVVFNYLSCCRSNSITTGLSGEEFKVKAWVNRCKAPKNSSPTFRTTPTDILCKNRQQSYTQGGNIRDTTIRGKPKDSLGYQLAHPLDSFGNKLSYRQPYSYKKPLKFKGFPNANKSFPSGFQFNPRTGDIQFTPVLRQASVLAIKVSEYRMINGKRQKIGETRRDVQFFVKNCSQNASPKVSSLTCTGDSSYQTLCEGEQTKLKFCSDDPDPNDQVKLNFRRGDLPPSAKFTLLNPNAQYQEGELVWKPGKGKAADLPYQFSVTAKDNQCPKPGSATKTFQLKVNPVPEASFTSQKLTCGDIQLKASTKKADSFKWFFPHETKTGQNITYRPRKIGKRPFRFQVFSKGCQNTYLDTLSVDTTFAVEIGSDTTICEGSSLKLGGNPAIDQNGPNTGPVQYKWHDSTRGYQQRNFTNIMRDTLITLTAFDDSCSFTDSVQVSVQQPPAISFESDTVAACKGDSLQLRVNEAYATYRWSTGDSAFRIYAKQKGWKTLKVSDQIGCLIKDSTFLKTLDTGVVNIRKKACDSSYWSPMDTFLSKAGIYRDTAYNPEFCDSFASYKFDLSLAASTRDTFSINTCGGYKVPSGDTTYQQSGTYSDTIPNANGCDSILHLNLNIQKYGRDTIDVVTCQPYTVPSSDETYKQSGTYYDTLVRQRKCDSVLLINLSIPVKDPDSLPEPGFTAAYGKACTPLSIQIKSNASGPVDSIRYQISNGLSFSSSSPTFRLRNEDTFKITQLAYNRYGCVRKDSLQLTVYESPDADYTVADTQVFCHEKAFSFENLSKPDQPQLQDSLLFQWAFGVPADSVVTDQKAEPVKKYSKEGDYPVQLVATNGLCKDSLKEFLQVRLRQKPVLDFSVKDSTLCTPANLTLTNATQHADSFVWDLEGQRSRSTRTPSYTINQPGTYDVQLRAFSREGCQDTLTKADFLKVKEQPEARFAYRPKIGCAPLTVNFENQSKPADQEQTYTWHMGNGKMLTTGSPTYTYPQHGRDTNQVRLIANNGFCADTQTRPVTITGFDGLSAAIKLTNVTVEDNQHIRLNWQPHPDGQQYRVQRKTQNGRWRYIATTDNTTYLDQEVDVQAKHYRYRVQGLDSCGNASASCNEGRNILLEGETEGNKSATLTWNPYQEWPRGVKEYHLQKSGQPKSFERLTSITDTKYQDQNYFNPKRDTQYYRVEAIQRGEPAIISTSNIRALPFEARLFIPDAFSPNGDGLNDIFRVNATGVFNYTLKVYNRWGEQVYESTDPDEGWDGSYQGEKAPSGVYFYTLYTTGNYGKPISREGTVQLIR